MARILVTDPDSSWQKLYREAFPKHVVICSDTYNGEDLLLTAMTRAKSRIFTALIEKFLSLNKPVIINTGDWDMDTVVPYRNRTDVTVLDKGIHELRDVKAAVKKATER